MKGHLQKPPVPNRPLRIGFVPLCDCAPLVLAHELGLFAKHGLRVQLSREVGWATIRDKIIYRELDAAHALAPMVLTASLGLGSIQAPALTGLVLSLNGNAITLAASLRSREVTDGSSLALFARGRGEPLVFGIPFLYSSHHFLLRAWLASHGMLAGRDVRLVVVPPPQMPAHLKAGHLDGYCVGEPWNTVATLAGFGWRIAKSDEIAPNHPEKVLMTLRGFAESRRDEHEHLIAALLEACRFCGEPGNREQVLEVLRRPQYINTTAEALRESLDAAALTSANGYTDFEAAHEPSADKAAWVFQHLQESGLLPATTAFRISQATTIFRPDIFKNALRKLQPHETTPSLVTS